MFKISDRGLLALASNPGRIDGKYLEQFPEFIAFRESSRPATATATATDLPESTPTGATPEEAIEAAHQGLRAQLGQELLARILEIGRAHV